MTMNRGNIKGAPLVLTTGRGRPRDPGEPPPGDLEAWAKYHGIEYVKGPDPVAEGE